MALLRLASASEGRAVLAAQDDFTRALGGFDRSFRLRTSARVDDADLRRFLGEQAVDFTETEAAAWVEARDPEGVTLAVDGLMMGEVWRLTPFTPEQREQIVSELLRLVDEAFDGSARTGDRETSA